MEGSIETWDVDSDGCIEAWIRVGKDRVRVLIEDDMFEEMVNTLKEA